MNDAGTDTCKRETSNPGIAKQIHNLRRRASGKAIAHPAPHRCHVGEKAEMTKRRGLSGKTHVAPGERPAVARNIAVELPPATTFIIACRNELSVGIPTLKRGTPKRLRFWPNETVSPITFKLATGPAVDQAVISPCFADERGWNHRRDRVPCSLT